MLICNVVGARPNFMKMAPVISELARQGYRQLCVHTGQHYDDNMSRIFFQELGLPRPDLYLNVGSDTHARQTARIMTEFEDFCLGKRPDLVIAGGDVNSTLAAALVTSKLRIPLAHVEAGLRSFDREMPEEINRILTDHVAELLFTTEASAGENLLREGIAEEKIHFVGNCMIDSLLRHVEHAVAGQPWTSFGLDPGRYALLTLHRPSNVDCAETFASLVSVMNEISEHLPVLFPVHPRTRRNTGLPGVTFSEKVRLCEPLPYLSFLGLMARARFVVTDSGGIQEETTALGIPCLTLRQNTERPCTVVLGTNRLVPERDEVMAAVGDILGGNWPEGQRPQLWDGHAAERTVKVIGDWSGSRNPAETSATVARQA